MGPEEITEVMLVSRSHGHGATYAAKPLIQMTRAPVEKPSASGQETCPSSGSSDKIATLYIHDTGQSTGKVMKSAQGFREIY